MTYRLRRYLAGATTEELLARARDVAFNSFTFTAGGQVAPLSREDVRGVWHDCTIHLAVEGSMRKVEPFDAFDLKGFVFTKRNLEAFRQQPHVLQRQVGGGVFCRYGRLEHMGAFRDRGEILLRGASYYSHKALDSARRDDELVLRTYLCPHDYDLGFVAPALLSHAPQRCFTHLDQRKPTDFYLFCFTAGFEIRLFADFKANACVVIHDQSEFERRLIRGARHALPGWNVQVDHARYHDPYNMPRPISDHGAEVLFCKHFGYMYQREWRLVVRPEPPTAGPLPDLAVSIGSLTDISELVVLSGDPFGDEPGRFSGEAG